MTKYVAQRLAMLVVILFGVLTITFALSRVLPSSPVEIMLGRGSVTEHDLDRRGRQHAA